jgi:antitoxin CptB
MRELDELLVRYLEHGFPVAASEERAAFARLLELQDPELFGYLLARESPRDESLRHVIDRIRREP